MTRYPFYRRLGGLQGLFGQVRNISQPTGIRSPDHPARNESLYRLLSKVPNINKTFFFNSASCNDYISLLSAEYCLYLQGDKCSSGCCSDTEDEMSQLFSVLQLWKIFSEVRICTGPMGIQGSLRPYWLWRILLPLPSKDSQTAICNGHISFPVSHHHPYE